MLRTYLVNPAYNTYSLSIDSGLIWISIKCVILRRLMHIVSVCDVFFFVYIVSVWYVLCSQKYALLKPLLFLIVQLTL